MANQPSQQRYVKQIRASLLLLKAAVEQRSVVMQNGALSNEVQLSCGEDSARAPNIWQSALHISFLTDLGKEVADSHWYGGNTFIVYKTNPFDTCNVYLGGRQTIEISETFHGLHHHIKRSLSFQKTFQSIYHNIKEELNLALCHVKSWLRTTVADICMA